MGLEQFDTIDGRLNQQGQVLRDVAHNATMTYGLMQQLVGTTGELKSDTRDMKEKILEIRGQTESIPELSAKVSGVQGEIKDIRGQLVTQDGKIDQILAFLKKPE